jgi:uncharacterized membrane-anchored protein
MKLKSILPILFLLLVLIQLYVPASVVFNQERINFSGATYKMQLAPIDPNDPFRGKYIILSFRENTLRLPVQSKFESGNSVYVVMKPGKNDFLKIETINKEFRHVESPRVCIKATIRSITEDDGYKEAQLVYPFTRFYLEESKALEAEKRYLKAASDTNSVSYGLIGVYNESVAVKDVIINGESLIGNSPKK